METRPTFEGVAEGWIFCTADLLARAGGHAETLERMLARYLEEAAVIRRRARVEEEVSLERLTDAVIQRGHADRYAGPLVGGRFQVMESLSPAGTYYVVDHALADLLVREAGGATPVRRFATRGAAEDYVAGIPPADDANKKEAVVAKSVTKKPKTAEKKTDAKPRGQGIGARTRELIMQGLDTDGVIAKLQKEFPNAANSASNVNYYRNQLKKEGADVPGGRAAKATNGTAAKTPKLAAPKKGGRKSAAAGATA